MLNKLIISTIPFLFFICVANAQTGSVSGKVSSSDGKPAVAVTVTLANKRLATTTNEDGFFLLKKIDTGAHFLTVSLVGLKTESRKIFVENNQTTSLTIVLAENAQRLKEVVINSHKNTNEQTLSSAKSSLAAMDLPQTVGTISSRVISDQQATRVGDVIKNVSGVSLTQTRLGVNETYSARGYSIGVAGAAGSVLKNGMITNTAGMPEVATLESVEVMKGSTAMLYGNVSGGLIVNLVTKKPKFEHGGEVKMQYGSYNQYKPIADIYGPITKQLAFRVLGTYENDKSFRDVVHTKRIYANPSLLYKPGKNTSLLVQADWLDVKGTPDFGIGTLDSGRIIPGNIPVSRFHNVLWAYNNVSQNSGSITLDHRLSEAWQVNFIAALQKTGVDSYGAGLPNTVNRTGDWNRTLARAHSIEKNASAQLNINGKFKTGLISHRLLAGADAARISTITDAFKITSNGSTVTAYDKINILDPSLYIRRNDIPDAALNTSTTAPGNRAGIYAQDFISLTKKIKFLAGIRWSYQQTQQTSIFTQSTQQTTKGVAATADYSAFSPKIALLYQPSNTSTMFGSYSNNFTINTGTDIYGALLKPSIIHQYEIGAKNNFFREKLSANISLYRIINSNLAQQAEFRADGTVNTESTVKELKGETTSDGFEIDLNYELSANLYFISGYGYNNMRFTKTSGAKGSNIEGERLVNNPQQTANFSGFYTFTKSTLKGLKLGLSSFYTGNRLGGYNNTVGQTQAGSRLLSLGGFTTVDVSAGYSICNISLQLKLVNVFNTVNYLVHDNYSIAPIAARQLTATIGYKF